MALIFNRSSSAFAGMSLSLRYIAVPAAMLSVWIAWFCTQFETRSHIQTNDPRLPEIPESQHANA